MNYSTLCGRVICAAVWPAGLAFAASQSQTINVPAQTPPLSGEFVVQRLDPAVGLLRCVDVQLGMSYEVAGELDVNRLGPGGPCQPPSGGSVTFCIGGSAAIFHTDAVGPVTHATAGGCTYITGTIDPKQHFNVVPFLAQGGASSRTLITSPALLTSFYVGVGPSTGIRQGFGLIEEMVAQVGPCISGNVAGITSFGAGAIYRVTYHFTPVAPCHGDTNGDGVIDFVDLNGVLGSFAVASACALGDVNNDGVVDFLDLNEVLGFFGTACTN